LKEPFRIVTRVVTRLLPEPRAGRECYRKPISNAIIFNPNKGPIFMINYKALIDLLVSDPPPEPIL
jgi:hypothetical protein